MRVGDIEVRPARPARCTAAERRCGCRAPSSTCSSTCMRHRGRVLTREQILSAVWGYEHDPQTNIVDVYVGYLRRKLGTPGNPAPIADRALGRLSPRRCGVGPGSRRPRRRHDARPWEPLAWRRPALAADGLGRGRDAAVRRRDLRGRLPRHGDRNCATRSTTSWRATRASSPTTSSSSSGPPPVAGPLPTRWRGRDPLRQRSALRRQLDVAVRDHPRRGHEHQPARAARQRRPRQRRDAPPSRTRRTASRSAC